jgi:hypothetical protein
MCGLYVRINAKQSHFAYIDYCNIQDTQTLKFKYYNSKTRNSNFLFNLSIYIIANRKLKTKIKIEANMKT